MGVKLIRKIFDRRISDGTMTRDWNKKYTRIEHKLEQREKGK